MKPADLVPSFVSALAEHTLLARLFLASIEFTVVAALIWFVLRIGLVRAPRLISALWLLALTKAVVSLAVGSPWAVLTWEPSAVAKGAEAKEVANMSDVRAHGSETKLVATPAPDQPESPQGSSAGAFPLVARGAEDERRASRSVADVSVASRLAGLAVSLMRSLVQRLRLRRIVLQSVAPESGLLAAYHATAHQLGLEQCPGLLVTEALESPALAGIWRPVVLVPAWLARTGMAQLEWPLKHELTHFRHHDPLANSVRELATMLFFFHPLVHWAGGQLQEALELACDRALVDDERGAAAYAGELFRLVHALRDRQRVPVAATLFAARTQLGRRIEALMHEPLAVPARLNAPRTALVLVTTAAVFSLGVGFRRSHASNEEPSGNQSASGAQDDAPTDEPDSPEQREIAALLKLGAKAQVFDDGATGRFAMITFNQPLDDAMYEHVLAFARLGTIELRTLGFMPGTVDDGLLAHLEGLSDVLRLNFIQCNVTDAGLVHLKHLPKLEQLWLQDTFVTGVGMAELAQTPRLKELMINSRHPIQWPALGDACLEQLPALEALETLKLSSAALTGASLAHLKRFPKLRVLELYSEKITDAGMESLAELSELSRLGVLCPRVGDDGIARLSQLANLEHLDLYRCGITDLGVLRLDVWLLRLKSLRLGGTRVTDATLATLGRSKNLESLQLDDCRLVGDAGLAHLRNIVTLTGLGLSGTMVTDGGLKHLKDLDRLESLNLADTKVDDFGLRQLERLSKLRNLTLTGCRVSPAAIRELKESLPELRVRQ